MQQTQRAQGGVRATVPMINAHPAAMAQAPVPGYTFFPPAPAGMQFPNPYPLPHLHAGAPAQWQPQFAQQPPPMPQVPLNDMRMFMPPNAAPAMQAPAPRELTPAGAPGNGTAASANIGAAPQPAASTAALPAGAATDIFQDKALMDAVASDAKSPNVWWPKYSATRGEERIRYGVAILFQVPAAGEEKRYPNRGLLMRVYRDLGVERLLAQKWPNGLVNLLVQLHLNEALAGVLKTEAGRKSLAPVRSAWLTPLHEAAFCRNLEAAKLILNCDGEGEALRTKQHGNRLLPIHAAVHMANEDMVDVLLSQAGREQRLTDSVAGLPLHVAIASGAGAAIVSKLLEDCATEQAVAQAGNGKVLPLMLAIKLRDIEAVKMLLAVRPALPQQLTLRDVHGRTAHDHAKRFGDAEIIALLDEAMKELPSSSASSSSTGTAGAASASATSSSGAGDAPVPLTPYPQTPMPEPEEFDFGETLTDFL